MPRRGRKRKKTRTHVLEDENAQSALASNEALKVPRSVVIRRGKVEAEVIELVSDVRKMMRPYTALHLKEDGSKNRKMKLSDYASRLTGTLGVTHILALTQNKSRINLRIARTPAGPTLGFQVRQFTLTRHVVSSQRRPYYTSALFDHSPVVVTNNFGDQTASPHVKLMRITFQNLFPAINVATVRLADCRRVVLFNLIKRSVPKRRSTGAGEKEQSSEEKDGGGGNEHSGEEEENEEEEEVVEVRHYAIKASPVGVDRKVRKLVQANIPNLGRLEDISDYIMGSEGGGGGGGAALSGGSGGGGGAMSDSEAEDETSHVVLPQRYHGRGNARSQKSALRLVELGPRLCLKLAKIERGLASGDVMYHAYIKKTPEEARNLKQKVEEAAATKKRRREEQEANVVAKREAKEAKKAEKKARREEREREAMDALRRGAGQQGTHEDDGSSSSSGDSEDGANTSDGEEIPSDAEVDVESSEGSSSNEDEDIDGQ